MIAKSKSSSRRWLHEHFTDPYVRQAQKTGARSRARYKLQQIHEKDKLFKPGMTVVDLGSTPGGWSEFVITQVGRTGRVIALDILPMKPIPGVEFMQGDLDNETFLQTLLKSVGVGQVDWVISDMAPELSGINSVDQPRAMALADLAFHHVVCILKPKQGFLIKLFQGEGFDAFLNELRRYFKKVVIRKPEASRGRSREVYILARM
jgi:23S rRNA (uridine2552-2'-O)-methyltransferase